MAKVFTVRTRAASSKAPPFKISSITGSRRRNKPSVAGTAQKRMVWSEVRTVETNSSKFSETACSAKVENTAMEKEMATTP